MIFVPQVSFTKQNTPEHMQSIKLCIHIKKLQQLSKPDAVCFAKKEASPDKLLCYVYFGAMCEDCHYPRLLVLYFMRDSKSSTLSTYGLNKHM
jgi:hypothetical protein